MSVTFSAGRQSVPPLASVHIGLGKELGRAPTPDLCVRPPRSGIRLTPAVISLPQLCGVMGFPPKVDNPARMKRGGARAGVQGASPPESNGQDSTETD